jgi:hypothetical protein
MNSIFTTLFAFQKWISTFYERENSPWTYLSPKNLPHIQKNDKELDRKY